MSTDLIYGYTVTAEFCGFSEPRAVVRQYGSWVSSHPSSEEAFAAIEARGGVRPNDKTVDPEKGDSK